MFSSHARYRAWKIQTWDVFLISKGRSPKNPLSPSGKHTVASYSAMKIFLEQQWYVTKNKQKRCTTAIIINVRSLVNLASLFLSLLTKSGEKSEKETRRGGEPSPWMSACQRYKVQASFSSSIKSVKRRAHHEGKNIILHPRIRLWKWENATIVKPFLFFFFYTMCHRAAKEINNYYGFGFHRDKKLRQKEEK